MPAWHFIGHSPRGDGSWRSWRVNRSCITISFANYHSALLHGAVQKGRAFFLTAKGRENAFGVRETSASRSASFENKRSSGSLGIIAERIRAP